jgi:SAM-dependent methyltransferase
MRIRLEDAGKYLAFLSERRRFERMPGGGKVPWRDLYPCLHEKTAMTSFDTHYFYQDIWAFRKIVRSGTPEHVDVGSKVDYIGFLTAVTKVTFIDIRPLGALLDNLANLPGSILAIPYPDDSVASLSCLHVAEHIGLGRYGDPLDPLGTAKACAELRRVLAPGGNLYFGLPVGKPRIRFNAHRIHSTGQILRYFEGLTLREFSFVDDTGGFTVNADMAVADSAKYGCGLFHFTKQGGVIPPDQGWR